MSALRRIAQVSKTRRGLTLVELVLVAALLAIFGYAAQETFISGLRAADYSDDREEVRLQLVKALDLLTREASAAYNVDRSDSDRFQFDARLIDNDSDGDAENRTDIDYRVQSGDLQRIQGGVTHTLVADCTSSTPFTYLDEDNNTTTDEEDVRVIQVSLSAARDGETITLSTSMRPRNLND